MNAVKVPRITRPRSEDGCVRQLGRDDGRAHGLEERVHSGEPMKIAVEWRPALVYIFYEGAHSLVTFHGQWVVRHGTVNEPTVSP